LIIGCNAAIGILPSAGIGRPVMRRLATLTGEAEARIIRRCHGQTVDAFVFSKVCGIDL
jgi:hypothetical protein